MERIAKFLRDLKVEPALVLSSPLPRARQTAEYAADALGVELQEEPALATGIQRGETAHAPEARERR